MAAPPTTAPGWLPVAWGQGVPGAGAAAVKILLIFAAAARAREHNAATTSLLAMLMNALPMNVLPGLSSFSGLEPELSNAVKIDSPDTVGGFSSFFKNAIEAVDAKQAEASRQVSAVDSGASDDLIGAMLSSQQAGLSFSMLIQVRNKVMGAFDDIMKMSV
jgi:flagellar hook-basal body complex protein FliE